MISRLGSTTVNISACHAEDLGSILSRDAILRIASLPFAFFPF